MGKIEDVLAEMRQERERLAADLSRVDRVIAALEEGGAFVGGDETIVPPGTAATTAAIAAQAKLAAWNRTLYAARHLRGDSSLPFNGRYAEELDRNRRRASGRRLQDTFEKLREHRSGDVAPQRRQIDRDFRDERREALVPQAKNRETKAAEGLLEERCGIMITLV